MATGIFAAETNPSLRIILLDGAKTIGAKILVSGGGRCNVTNQKVTASDFHGNRRVLDRILRRFDEQATIRWFDSLGVLLQTEITGKLFPVSNKARTVLNALLDRYLKLSVTLLTQHHVQSITHLVYGYPAGQSYSRRGQVGSALRLSVSGEYSAKPWLAAESQADSSVVAATGAGAPPPETLEQANWPKNGGSSPSSSPILLERMNLIESAWGITFISND